MVSDGGMKIDRAVCAHKFSMLRQYKNINKYVLTGCTASPTPGSPFCSNHQNHESPVLLAGKVSRQTYDKLKQYREKTTSSHIRKQTVGDSVFIVERVLDRKGNQYLVMFSRFPEAEACWEPKSNLPAFIVDHYKEKGNLGAPLLLPTIKRNQDRMHDLYFNIDWTRQSGDKLSLLSGQNLYDLDADRLSEEVVKSTCNTRKNKNKRDRRHTAGILI